MESDDDECFCDICKVITFPPWETCCEDCAFIYALTDEQFERAENGKLSNAEYEAIIQQRKADLKRLKRRKAYAAKKAAEAKLKLTAAAAQ